MAIPLRFLGRAVCAAFLLGTVTAWAQLPRKGPNAPSGAVANAKEYRVFVGLRTSLSGGKLSPEQVQKQAAKMGCDAVFLADSLWRGLEYGWPPFRYSLWIEVQKPSVLSMGPARYVRAVEALNGNQSLGLPLMVPGVRVCPRYYWSGFAPLNLVCHNRDRTILMLGVHDSRALTKLSVANGFILPRDRWWVFFSRFLVLLCVGIWIGYFYLPGWIRHRFHVRRRKTRGIYFVFVLIPSVVLLFFFNLWLSGDNRFNLYQNRTGLTTEQTVLNQGNSAGYFQVWSRPQQGWTTYHWPITFDTEPLPNLISLTQNYHAASCFAAGGPVLYKPGALWDQRLLEYLSQVSPYPVWLIGDFSAHEDLDNPGRFINENLVRAEKRSAQALVAALMRGHFYARRRTMSNAIAIRRFAVEGVSFGDSGSISKKAASIDIAVDSLLPGTPVNVVIVRNGKALYRIQGKTPLLRKISDPLDRFRVDFYYRIIVTGPGALAAVGQPAFIHYVSPDLPRPMKD